MAMKTLILMLGPCKSNICTSKNNISFKKGLLYRVSNYDFSKIY